MKGKRLQTVTIKLVKRL